MIENCCVYLHKDRDNNVRYVGHGTEIRAKNNNPKSGRGVKYQEYTETSGRLITEILFNGLSKEKAIKFELKLFKIYSQSGLLLNNKKPNGGAKLIPQEVLAKVEYNESSKSHLVWKVGPRKGKDVGCVNNMGYYTAHINYKVYLVHRIIYFLHHTQGGQFGWVIDHIDRNRLNNKIENLREISFADNLRNKSKKSQNH